jgi:dCMP deaminase
MPTQAEDDNYYLGVALQTAKRSKANRKKVGAVLVTPSGIMIPGYNGTAPGADNSCENSEGLTKPEVIHAELNCIIKCSKEGISAKGSTIYVSLSPCLHCSSLLIASQVKRLVWYENYRCNAGLDLLRSAGLELLHLDKLTGD